MLVRYGKKIYRYAFSPVLIAKWFLNKLWDWVYRNELTYEELYEWLKKVLGKFGKSAAVWDPDDKEVVSLVEQLMTVMAKSGMFPGDLLKEILSHKLMDQPPAPYRWEVDGFGRKRLVKTRSKISERGIIKGKKLVGKSLIGAWWTTKTPRSSAHRSLVAWIKENNGNVFLNWTIPGESGGMGGGREYGAFIIIPTESAADYGKILKAKVENAVARGDGEFLLSAVTLDGLAEGNRVENEDKLNIPGVANSIKFNWDYTLPTLLNGGVAEYKGEREYLNLVNMLRKARDAI